MIVIFIPHFQLNRQVLQGGRTAFNLNFGNEFCSLPDKTRDQKREFCKNLKAVVIDEAFVLKSDDIYKLHLRMQELTQKTSEPFGGIAMLLLGDILQLKPVMGKFIFEIPACQNYHTSFNLDPIWKMFDVVRLTFNHRQGEDHIYADILNRIRMKKKEDCISEDDCAILEKRVRKSGDEDLPTNALHIMSKNENVMQHNDKQLEKMDGDLVQIQAKVEQGSKVIQNPKLDKDGSVKNTPLQYCLRLKKGAQVMLTYNVNVVDSLANGTLGKVVDFEKDKNGMVKTVLVQFKNEKAGQETRARHEPLTKKYSTTVTPIFMIEFPFHPGKKNDFKNDSYTATQFPLKLAFACTAHKMQGSTVSKPDQLVIDLTQVFEAAQSYVMMSRVQSLSQLYILDKLPTHKIYASEKAMEELKRLDEVSLNEQEKLRLQKTGIISLNIRSLNKNLCNLIKAPQIAAKIIALQETWCLHGANNEHDMRKLGYESHFVSQGQGTGVVTYYKDGFKATGLINSTSYQMSKVSSDTCDVVNV